jgi:DNA-binding FadR family transcriptional regulator
MLQQWNTGKMGSGKLGQRLINQHKRIFEAIRRKETEDAQALMLKHVKAMKALFRRYEIEKNRESKKNR